MLIGIRFLFGLAVGSFINCVVYRLNHNLSPLRGRSFCPKCKHQLAWFDNIPLFSFFRLQGKCRYCHQPISIQYPLVELATGILTLVIIHYPFSIFHLLVTYALIAIFVSDLIYMTIPDEIIYPAIIIALLNLLIVYHVSPVSHFLSAVAAAGFFYLLVKVSQGKGMGQADIKLAALMGLILGWPKILMALYLAFLTGAVVGVILIILKKKRFGQMIPFGPFLAGATYLSLIYGQEFEKIFNYWFHFN